MSNNVFSDKQIDELNRPLASAAIKHRKGGGNKELSYIEGHDAIDTANRIFGYGMWGYHLDSIEQVIIVDPISGEGIGIEYKATMTVQVDGAQPITDVGSQPVATCSVDEQCWNRRLSDAKYHKKPVDETPFTDYERKNARAVIMEAHEQAKKAAATDVLKRCLRAYGNQFGNSLYGPDRAESADNANTSTGAPTPIITVQEKLAKSRAQAFEFHLVEPGEWEAFKSEKLGAAIADGDVTGDQYKVLYAALKTLLANKKAS